MSAAKRAVACSFGKSTEKFAPPVLVRSIAADPLRDYLKAHKDAQKRLGRAQRLGGRAGRKRTRHRRALPDDRSDSDRAAVQFDERAHQREAYSRPAMMRAERM